MIKGVLFDFNGTLLFDSDKHILAFQQFMRKKGLRVMSAEEIAELTFGRTNSDIFKILYDGSLTTDELDALALEKEALYREICLASPDGFSLAPGAYEMLDFLKREGIPFNIATGSGMENVEFYYKELDLGRWLSIDTIVYNDHTLRGKPEPDFYIEAAKKIGLEPSECIVFEDALSGFISARGAGAAAIYALVTEGHGELLSGGVKIDGEIGDFKGYLSILKKHGLL